MRIVHEWLGDLELPDAPGRVVSLAPNATETVFLLGGGQRLIGGSTSAIDPTPPASSSTSSRRECEMLAAIEPLAILGHEGD